MRNYNIKTALVALAMSAATFAGCSKFLDVNENPNSPTKVDAKFLLPSIQGAIGQALGVTYQVHGSFWAQYWTQSRGASQYKAVDQYQPGLSDFDRVWALSYSSAGEDIELILAQKSNIQYSQYVALAYFLKAYNFQLLTDAFGDVPLVEASQGNNNLNPKYDKQEAVYDSIFNYIKYGMTAIDVPVPAAFKVGAEDLFFGTAAKNNDERVILWKKFANTLKLRAALRLVKVNEAKSKKLVEEVYKDAAGFLTIDAKISYIATGGNQYPLWGEIVGLTGTLNITASATAIDEMKKLNDPRVPVFYAPATGGEYVGLPQGSYADQPSNAPVSLPGVAVGANSLSSASALAPLLFISASESNFLQAEAIARGFANGDVAGKVKAGIEASFATFKVTDNGYVAAQVAALPATTDARVEAIVTQKYFAMNGNQGFEAWTEWRRTGYPKFFVRPKMSVLPAGQWPLRFLYPNTEFTRNTNYPGTIEVNVPVWWDK